MKKEILKEFDERYFNPSVPSPSDLKDFISQALDKQKAEFLNKIENKVECASFSEDPNFVCKKVLPISEMQATVKNPNIFYCRECYRRGVEMEEEAMGLR